MDGRGLRCFEDMMVSFLFIHYYITNKCLYPKQKIYYYISSKEASTDCYTIIPMEIGAQEHMDEYYLPMTMNDENTQNCLSNIIPPPYLDILIAHPSSFPGEISIAEGWDSTPGHFLNLCILYHLWEGENNIWLWSCRSGSNGVGQALADLSGVEVKAPLYPLYCGYDGFYFTTDMPFNEVNEVIDEGNEKNYFNEEEQSDKWVVLHPNDSLNINERGDFEDSLSWLVVVLLWF